MGGDRIEREWNSQLSITGTECEEEEAAAGVHTLGNQPLFHPSPKHPLLTLQH